MLTRSVCVCVRVCLGALRQILDDVLVCSIASETPKCCVGSVFLQQTHFGLAWSRFKLFRPCTSEGVELNKHLFAEKNTGCVLLHEHCCAATNIIMSAVNNPGTELSQRWIHYGMTGMRFNFASFKRHCILCQTLQMQEVNASTWPKLKGSAQSH